VLFEHKIIDFKELSKTIDLKTGTLSPILTNLQKKGLIEKIVNQEDKRNIYIELTPKGEELNNDILSVPVELYNKIQISEDMYNVLVKELDDLKEILENAEIKNKK
jgi:DNA-binding MarR family transcriptional regulator